MPPGPLPQFSFLPLHFLFPLDTALQSGVSFIATKAHERLQNIALDPNIVAAFDSCGFNNHVRLSSATVNAYPGSGSSDLASFIRRFEQKAAKVSALSEEYAWQS